MQSNPEIRTAAVGVKYGHYKAVHLSMGIILRLSSQKKHKCKTTALQVTPKQISYQIPTTRVSRSKRPVSYNLRYLDMDVVSRSKPFGGKHTRGFPVFVASQGLSYTFSVPRHPTLELASPASPARPVHDCGNVHPLPNSRHSRPKSGDAGTRKEASQS